MILTVESTKYGSLPDNTVLCVPKWWPPKANFLRECLQWDLSNVLEGTNFAKIDNIRFRSHNDNSGINEEVMYESTDKRQWCHWKKKCQLWHLILDRAYGQLLFLSTLEKGSRKLKQNKGMHPGIYFKQKTLSTYSMIVTFTECRLASLKSDMDDHPWQPSVPQYLAFKGQVATASECKAGPWDKVFSDQ